MTHDSSIPADGREAHIRTGRHIKAIVYAASDGIVATFAIVAAAVGGKLSPGIILVVGVADMIAEGLSMAAGDYLGTRSERDLYGKEEVEEWREVRELPDVERAEVREILAAKGYAGQDLDDLTRLITSREQFWIDFMMAEELGMKKPDGSALTSALVTFVSFVAAGTIPLLPYVIWGGRTPFATAAAATGIALFIIGALRVYFSRQSWVWLGLEMFLVGGTAAAIAYGIGFGLKAFV